MISDLLDSLLQGEPCAFLCRRWQSYARKFSNSLLQFLHLKLRNRSVCGWLRVWLFWRCIGSLSDGNRSVWARCFALRVRTWLFAVQVTEAGIMISKHFNKQPAKTIFVKACIVNETDGFIHLDMIVINVSASKINEQTNSNSNDSSKIWNYNDLHVLNLLRQSKQSDNQSLRVNCQWFHAPASCFRNCCSFFDYLWAGLLIWLWRDVVSSSSRRMPRKASETGFAGAWCDIILWLV